MHLKCIFKRRN